MRNYYCLYEVFTIPGSTLRQLQTRHKYNAVKMNCFVKFCRPCASLHSKQNYLGEQDGTYRGLVIIKKRQQCALLTVMLVLVLKDQNAVLVLVLDDAVLVFEQKSLVMSL